MTQEAATPDTRKSTNRRRTVLLDLDGGAKLQLATLVAIIVFGVAAGGWAESMRGKVTRLEAGAADARLELRALRHEWAEFRGTVVADYGARVRVLEVQLLSLQRTLERMTIRADEPK